MTMTRDFCTKFKEACSKEEEGYATIAFPDYAGGVDYCEKHVGSSEGDDNYWSFPYTEGALRGSAGGNTWFGRSCPKFCRLKHLFMI